MKESIGSTQIFIIVVTLLILFAGIMAFTINHSNAFSIKDQLVSVIEASGGFDINCDIGSSQPCSDVLEEIVELLQSNSYRALGSCEAVYDDTDVTYYSYERDGTHSNSEKASFCLAKIKNSVDQTGGKINGYYYQIVVFYNLDLPVINTLFNFKLIGQSKIMYS